MDVFWLKWWWWSQQLNTQNILCVTYYKREERYHAAQRVRSYTYLVNDSDRKEGKVT